MSGFMAARDAIRDFLRKYDEITTPLLRFVAALIVFISINIMYGYSGLFEKGIVIFLLSVIAALTSDIVVVLLGGIVVLVNILGLSVELGITALVMFVLIYCIYMRMFPDCAWVLAFVPIMLILKMYYAAPLVVMIFAGASGIVPTIFGVVIYYFSLYTREIVDGSMLEDEDFQSYKYIVDGFTKDKTAMALMISAAIVILIASIIYKLPFSYSWYVAIGVGGVCDILFSLIVNSSAGVDISAGSVLAGSLTGMVLAFIVQVCRRVADYAHWENVQFEDDDYYYYVKAVPKLNTDKKKKTSRSADTAATAAAGAKKKMQTKADISR